MIAIRPEGVAGMLDQEDLKWIATASTELNSTLQQIARHADLARRSNGNKSSYIDRISESVQLASQTSQALFDRVTGSILAGVSKCSPLSAPPDSKPLASAVSAGAAAIADAVVSDPVEPEARNPDGTRELILVIDDDPEIATLASGMLMEEGYQVIVAKDGFEALNIYKEMGAQIGLIILDFFLPVMDGDAVFDELRGMDPDVNVVLSSGFAEQSKVASMLAQGLRGFIPKPYTREKLLEQVSSSLAAVRC